MSMSTFTTPRTSAPTMRAAPILAMVPDKTYYVSEMDKDSSGRRAGIDPDRWGRHVWDALHYITLGYPETNAPYTLRQSAYDYIFSLQYLLPCQKCRRHLAEILQYHMPLTADILENRRTLGEYVVAMRDHVKRAHVLAPAHAKHWPRHTFDEDVVRRLLSGSPHDESDTSWGWLGILFSMTLGFLLAKT